MSDLKIAFLTNILTPYRVFFFDLLSDHLGVNNLKVFVITDKLPLRPWSYEKLKRDYTMLLKSKSVFIGGNDYLFSSNVNREISKFAPDALIIAGSWTYPATWKVMLSKRITKNSMTYFWTESHNHTGLPNSTKTKPIIRKLKNKIINRFDGFCMPGKYAVETVTNLVDVSNKTIIRLPNLIDNQYYDKANQMRADKKQLKMSKNINDDRFVFFTPARMCDLKGQLPFFSNVADAVKDKKITFILAGEGPDKESIMKIGKENGLDIRIYDYQNQEQIREWLALSDAFLLPSLSDSNPLSNIEAAWAGLPLCISCYVGNGPELVEDGINGVIFDTLDKNSVVQKIQFIIEKNEDWLINAGNISHKKAEDGFESIRESEKFIEAIKKSFDKKI